MKRIGVVLSGCGYLDGAEIRESVLTLLAIDRAGAEAIAMAPDIDQTHVVNHLTQEEMPEKRNVLVESARIARGDIQDLKTVSASDLDALILPGGFGAAKNLSDFATKGADCKIQPDLERLLRDVYKLNKPIGSICIAPAVIAKMAEEAGDEVTLTIGEDEDTASVLIKMGVNHVKTTVDEVVIDHEKKLVSTSAYMLPDRLSKIERGISRLVDAVVEMT